MTTRPLWGNILPFARVNSSPSPIPSLRFFPQGHEVQIVRLADGQVDADGVDAGYRVQQRGLAAPHEIAGCDLALADQAGDGRQDRTVAEVQLGQRDVAFRLLHGPLPLLDGRLLVHLCRRQLGRAGFHVGPGRLLGREGGVVILLRDGLLLGQGLQAIDVIVGLGQVGFGDFDVRLGGLDVRLVLGETSSALALGSCPRAVEAGPRTVACPA